MSRNHKALMRKLNQVNRSALEAAIGMCQSQSHYEVEIEHWLIKHIEANDSDIRRILAAARIEASRVSKDLQRAIERFKTGNPRSPSFSQTLMAAAEQAWTIASLDFGSSQIRSGHLLLAILSSDALFRQLQDSLPRLTVLRADKVAEEFLAMTSGSPEEPATTDEELQRSDAVGERGTSGGALDKYTQDLTAHARAGRIDAIVGRDDEIRQMVDILMRRRQNNPILTGEAGVGKTAVVEGLACQIAEGKVPEPLKNVIVRSLDLGLLQAGAGVQGEFQNRLKSVLEETKASPIPIILFIDEAHTLIGAGGAAGQGDAANLLKPALARGELRTIAATTWSEYKKYFEKDAALTRRFQVVKVDEPDEKKAVDMLRPVAQRLELHHRVPILLSAVNEAVVLSSRYLTGRQLPDKAVSVLDTAGARVAISQVAVPPELEDLERKLANLGVESKMLEREANIGLDHHQRHAELEAERGQIQQRISDLRAQWELERRLVGRMKDLRQQMHEKVKETAGEDAKPDRDALLTELRGVEEELQGIQGQTPLLYPWVDGMAVAEVISRWTGIPMGKMLKDELNTVRNLGSMLGQRVVGQDHALDAIAQRIQTSKASLDDPGKPVGVFLLVGPSGVGKTETAVALADILFGGERNLITINMSEFQEKHTVSSLKGAPPGYVGYGEGGVLTEAVRRKPYSVVLLDEVEKAHPDVLKLFYQVFDKGEMDDGEGREINFRNTIIFLTSNLGTGAIMEACKKGAERPEPELLIQLVRPKLLAHMELALLGRLVVIPFYPLADEQLRSIVRLKLNKIVQRVKEKQKISLQYSDDVVNEIVRRCTEVESGARNVDHILTRTLLPEISKEVLGYLADGKVIRKIRVDRGETSGFHYEFTTDDSKLNPVKAGETQGESSTALSHGSQLN